MDRIKPDAIADVAAERRRQQSDLGYDAENDDRHTFGDWAWLISKRSVELSTPVTTAIADPRAELVQIAAIAVAAIESFDRKEAANSSLP